MHTMHKLEAQPTGDYEIKGAYHEALDPNWKYYPVYLEKTRLILEALDEHKGKRILDLGCGEGVFVRRLRELGHDVRGLDLHYQSDVVERGSMLDAPFSDESFDIVLCLDVLEHLQYAEQDVAIREIQRMLKPGGLLIATLPNLAHFASRVSFLLLGKLLRTAEIHRHPGDRPLQEWKRLLETRFTVERIRGVFPSYPLISLMTWIRPASSVKLHRLYNRFFALPEFCFLNFYWCRKR